MNCLDRRDIEVIVAQCRNQGATSPEQVAGFALAYTEAREVARTRTILNLGKTTASRWLERTILHWAALVERVNGGIVGYRTIPAYFQNMNFGLKPELIPRAMTSFCEAYAEQRLSPLEAYKEFEKIHPFVDGNGRVGHLLWAMRKHEEEREWPYELPPKIFDE